MPKHGSIKIALVYPPYQNNKFVLFSLAYLVNGLRRQNPNAEFRVFDCPAMDYGLDVLHMKLEKYQPDIVGISIPFTLMVNSALSIINKCQNLFPESWMVVGGMHATLCPEDLFNKCDYVVMGEGERPMNQIIRGFLSNQKKTRYPWNCF